MPAGVPRPAKSAEASGLIYHSEVCSKRFSAVISTTALKRLLRTQHLHQVYYMPDILTVSQLTDHLSTLLRQDERLSDLTITGEISNPLLAKSGHFYFSMKDADATVSCVMWRNAVRKLFEIPQEGQSVIAHGRVDIYAPRGQLQVVVDALRAEGGIGELYRRYEEIKTRLQAEGLLENKRKRPLPALPRRVGLVTSGTGAALRDILRTWQQRWPLIDVLLVPSLVQGVQAPAALQAALYRLYARDDIDVIVIARGGGSIEDLWAFNDEGLARLIVQAAVPVVSGVGHETDFTIADFVADLRAPTPTAAAAAVTPDRDTIKAGIESTKMRLAELTLEGVNRRRLDIERLGSAVSRHSPHYAIDQQRLMLDDLDRRLSRSLQERVARLRLALESDEQRLHALNPTAVLTRGYAIVQDADGQVIHATTQVHGGQSLHVRVRDGSFPVTVDPKM